MCTRQSRKVIWDMNRTLFLTLQLSNLLLLLFFSTRKHASMTSHTILSNFFQEQWTQNRPQYLSGLSRALSPTTFLEIAVCATFTNRTVTFLDGALLNKMKNSADEPAVPAVIQDPLSFNNNNNNNNNNTQAC